jgi:hypothetical protein
MSLYNMIFGQNPLSDVLLSILDLDRSKVGRFRDVHLHKPEDGGPIQIAIYTRNGGGNRECWNDDKVKADSEQCDCCGCFMSYRVQKIAGYVRDEDDDFDRTYATIYFRCPERFVGMLEKLVDEKAGAPNDRWVAFLDKMRSEPNDPDVARVATAMAPVFQKITETLAGEQSKATGETQG